MSFSHFGAEQDEGQAAPFTFVGAVNKSERGWGTPPPLWLVKNAHNNIRKGRKRKENPVPFSEL